jgi:hypothetical protein
VMSSVGLWLGTMEIIQMCSNIENVCSLYSVEMRPFSAMPYSEFDRLHSGFGCCNDESNVGCYRTISGSLSKYLEWNFLEYMRITRQLMTGVNAVIEMYVAFVSNQSIKYRAKMISEACMVTVLKGNNLY